MIVRARIIKVCRWFLGLIPWGGGRGGGLKNDYQILVLLIAGNLECKSLEEDMHLLQGGYRTNFK